MTPRYLEQDFEEHIEEHLIQSGYSSLNSTTYDKTLCLVPSQLIEFIQESQPKTFKNLEYQYGSDTTTKLLKATGCQYGYIQAAALLLCDRVTIFFGSAAGVAIKVDSNDSNKVDEAILGSVGYLTAWCPLLSFL